MDNGGRRSGEAGRTEARSTHEVAVAESTESRPVAVPVVTPPVVFFDGECGLCTRSVRWLLKRDRRRVLRFAPLQGEVAARTLQALPSDPTQWSIVLWDTDATYHESDAALHAVAAVGGVWRLAGWLLFVPRVMRDGVYRVVARNRVRWFGRVDSCAPLSAEERDRLLP